MHRLRFLVLAAGATAAAIFAATALAGAFQSGQYTGTTEQGKAISFKVTQGQVKKLRFTTVALCESGYGSKGRSPTSTRRSGTPASKSR
jgi:hypothetical protein